MKITSLTIMTLITLLFYGCNDHQKIRHEEFNKWLENNGKIKVISTTGMINDLVKEVGGDHIDSLILIQGDLDPHSYQLVKGDDEKLTAATIIFYNSLGLEHGPSLQKYLLENPKAVGLGNVLDSSDIIEVQGQKDPHIWMDISLWAKTLPIIVKTLSDKIPEHREFFQNNAKRFEKEMLETHERVKKIMGAVPEQKRYLVTSHDAFNYFTRAYLSPESEIKSNEWKKRFVAPEGLSPDSQLSTGDIKFIISHVKKHGITLLFPETNVSRDSIYKIIQAANEEGLTLSIADCCPLYGDAMGAPGSEGDTYLKMIEHNAHKIASEMNRP
jgi:manganese/zinc/iron transport system substrate-binding protein